MLDKQQIGYWETYPQGQFSSNRNDAENGTEAFESESTASLISSQHEAGQFFILAKHREEKCVIKDQHFILPQAVACDINFIKVSLSLWALSSPAPLSEERALACLSFIALSTHKNFRQRKSRQILLKTFQSHFFIA